MLWFKEFLINEGTSAARARGGKYVAWVDGDITFQSPTWARDTIAALQRYAVVQPWTTAHLLGPNGETLRSVSSFGAQHVRGAWYGAWRGNDNEVRQSARMRTGIGGPNSPLPSRRIPS